jgi:DNA-binding GntR family transcriptional regulator
MPGLPSPQDIGHRHYREHRGRADINQDFHLTIARAAGAPRLAALINDFREFFLNLRWLARQTEAAARMASRHAGSRSGERPIRRPVQGAAG